MKNFALLPLLAGAALLTGCVASGPQPVLTGAPAYPGYYGQGYYNDPPPGTPYGPVYGPGPAYAAGEVAVVRTDVYHGRVYNERDSYYHDGHRYARVYRDGNNRNRPVANNTRPTNNGRVYTQPRPAQVARTQHASPPNPGTSRQANRRPSSPTQRQP